MQANAYTPTDTILLPSGIFTMTLAGDDEQAFAGDYDIINPVEIVGNGVDKTVIMADLIDRAFEIRGAGTAAIRHLTIQSGGPLAVLGEPANGGGILARNDLSLYEVAIKDSNADYGGGIYTEFGTTTLENVTLQSNMANFAGGGLYITNTLPTQIRDIDVSGSTFVWNNSLGGGSALFHTGRNTIVNVESSTFSGNAMAFDGGVIQHEDGQITLNNVTIADNNGNNSAIHNGQNGTTFKISNSIIGTNFNNGFTGNCSGVALNSLGSNISADASCVGGGVNDQTTTDPMLGTLDKHDGSTVSYDLQAGSPAIDGGDPFQCAARDQRGVQMFVDGNLDGTNRCDIGAHELFGANSMNVQPNIDRSGGKTVLAWTVDADANIGTSVDRRVVVAEWDAVNSVWVMDLPQELPNHVDSADIAYNSFSNRTHLVFLYHNLLDDGQTRSGIFTNRAELWTAEKPDGGTWQNVGPIPTEDYSDVVRGEAPRIEVVEATGEVMTIFREFGEVGTNAALGQMAMANMQAHQTDFRPRDAD